VVGIKVVGNRFGIEVVGIKVVGNRFGIKVVGNRFDLNRTDVVAINVTDQNQTTEPILKGLSQTKPLLHSQATWVAEEPDAGHRGRLTTRHLPANQTPTFASAGRYLWH
jgi:hypothetical protein